MISNTINLAYLKQSFISLEKALTRSVENPTDLEVRDGGIQRFEYTYELIIKIIKRYLEINAPVPSNIDHLNFRDLLRLAAESGLITNIDLWFQFREARNNTSHGYDENKAKLVFQLIPTFVKEAQQTITILEKKTKDI